MAAWKEETRRCVEAQATLIEEVFARHRLSAVVTGGVIYPHSVDFQIEGQTRLLVGSRARILERELAEFFSVPEVQIICREAQATVRVIVGSKQGFNDPLNLLELMASTTEIQPLTSILGAAADERPLLLNFQTAEVSNVLVVGNKGAGKTTLLRTLLYSLAATNKQQQLQAAVIDYRPASGNDESISSFAAFSYLPHLIEPVTTSLNRATQILDLLVKELQYRDNHEIQFPKILLVIDNLDSLLEDGQRALKNRLIHLLQYGAEVGIHVVLALEKTSGPFTNQILKCDLPVRLVGCVDNEKLARAAAGITETGAELLPGQGAFVAVSAGRTFRFKSAYISDYDLYLGVEKLTRQKRQRIVPQTAEYRVGLVRAGR